MYNPEAQGYHSLPFELTARRSSTNRKSSTLQVTIDHSEAEAQQSDVSQHVQVHQETVRQAVKEATHELGIVYSLIHKVRLLALVI